MSDFIQITTTSDKREILQVIASKLVESRLAACVQIGGPMESIYRWQEKLETAEEWTCHIKTSVTCQESAISAIRKQHNYDEPEIIITPIAGGSAGYLQWINQQIKSKP